MCPCRCPPRAVRGQIWRARTKPLGFHPLCRAPLYCHNAVPPLLPRSLPPCYLMVMWPPGEVTKCRVKAKPTPLPSLRPHVPPTDRLSKGREGETGNGHKDYCSICSCSRASDHSCGGHSQVFGIHVFASLSTAVEN